MRAAVTVRPCVLTKRQRPVANAVLPFVHLRGFAWRLLLAPTHHPQIPLEKGAEPITEHTRPESMRTIVLEHTKRHAA